MSLDFSVAGRSLKAACCDGPRFEPVETLDLGFDVVPFDGATQRAAFISDVLTP